MAQPFKPYSVLLFTAATMAASVAPTIDDVPQATLDAYTAAGHTAPVWVSGGAVGAGARSGYFVLWVLMPNALAAGGSGGGIGLPLTETSVLQESIILDFMGDSNTAGWSATDAEGATGYRLHLQRTLARSGVPFRMVGLKGYGADNGTGSTFGKDPAVGDFNSLTYVLQDWRMNGFSGRRASGPSTVITNITVATPGVFTANSHGLGNGSPVVIGVAPGGTLPTVVGITPVTGADGNQYLVGFAVATATNTFQLSAQDNGTAAQVTAAGSGTLTAHTGGAEMVFGIVASHDVLATDSVLMFGTNDISILVDTSAPDQLATVQARLTLFFANYQLANPTARKYVPSLLPFTSGATNQAAKQTLRDQVNAWLATYVPTLGALWTYVPIEVSEADMRPDGIHAAGTGYALYGVELGRRIIAACGQDDQDEIQDESFVVRIAQGCVELRATTDDIRFPAQASTNVTSNTFWFSIWHMPFETGAGPRVVVQQETPYNNGCLLALTNDQLSFYWRSGGVTMPVSNYTRAIERFKWHHLFVFCDRVKKEWWTLCNGKTVQRGYNPSAADVTPSVGWYIGGQGGLDASVGLYQQFCLGFGAMSIEEAHRMAWRQYRKGEDPRNLKAKYLLNGNANAEVTGGTAGVVTITTGGFVPAGDYEKPFDKGYKAPTRVFQRRTITAAYTCDLDEVVKYDATAGAFGIAVPTPVGADGRGPAFIEVGGSANNLTLTPAAGQIDGAGTKVIGAAGARTRLISDNANYFSGV